MNRKIKIFSNPQFEKIRTVESESGIPLFHATDVAKALGYENPNEAIVINCRSGNIDRIYIAHSNGIGGVNMMFIPETEVYRLIMRSKLPEAEKFQDWVCEEVLPSIRKHGAYMTKITLENILEDPDFLIELLTKMKKEQELKSAAVAEKDQYREITRNQTIVI